MDNSYQHSTIAQILENILEEFVFEGESRSDIADILLSILNKTEYNKETDSVIADLLVRLKAKIEGSSFDPYDGDSTSRIADIIISILEETEYNEAPQSRIAELLLELKEELESITEITVSGSIASFVTNMIAPIVSGKFSIVAQQSGVSAINISATGLNLWGGGYMVNSIQNAISSASVDTENKTVSYSASATANGHLFDFPKPTQYTLIFKIQKSNTNLGVNMRIVWNDSTSSVLTLPEEATEPITFIFVTPEGKIPSYISKANQSGTTYLYYDECGIFEGVHTVNDFEPFGAYTTINIGSTVYGGEYDARTGVLTVTHGITELGSLTWGYTASGNRFTSSGVSNVIKFPATDSTVADIIADIFETKSLTVLRASADDNLIAVGDSGTISIRCTTYGTDANAFKTAMSGHYIVYELDTSQTIQLAPCPIDTLEGVNNIWTNTGNSEITYLYKGTPPETLTRVLSKSPNVEDIIKEEKLEDLNELQDLDISDKEVK